MRSDVRRFLSTAIGLASDAVAIAIRLGTINALAAAERRRASCPRFPAVTYMTPNGADRRAGVKLCDRILDFMPGRGCAARKSAAYGKRCFTRRAGLRERERRRR